MKKAINVKKGRVATTNEVIKFAFINAIKEVTNELNESRNIELGNDVSVAITDDEIHHVNKIYQAFLKKYGECSEIVTGEIKTTVEIITD